MTTEQKIQIQSLNQQGYSVRDIANELELNSAAVEEVLTTSSFNDVNSDFTDDDLETIAEILLRVQKEKIQLNEERQQLLADKTAFQQKMAQLPEQEEQFESFRKRAHKEKMAARFNFLLDEVLTNCVKATWSGAEVDDYLERASSLKEKVRKFCDVNRIDERRLLIDQGLTFIIDQIEAMQRKQTSGFFASRSVRFDFGDELQAKIKAFQVSQFESEVSSDLTQHPLLGDDEVWEDD